MNNRIKQIRKEAKLNQSEFGKILGVSQPAIAGYEAGTRIPIDAIIISICKEFNVNEEWLRTGSGDLLLHLLIPDPRSMILMLLLPHRRSPI